jgi:hypothetical protein
MMAEQKQEKAIPIMPCPDIRSLVTFYKELGFEVLGLYTSPNPYAALKWNNIELHFYGSRKVIPSENSTMCYVAVLNVDEVNRVFSDALKKYYGKIPRTGFPKITKVRDLAADRRFTLTDPGGNTLFIGEANATEKDTFFRTLANQEYAKMFAALYDVLYSKEDPMLAESMLPKYSGMAANLQGLDKAKYLLVLAEIQKCLGEMVNDEALKMLIEEQKEETEEWQKIRKKHLEVTHTEP